MSVRAERIKKVYSHLSNAEALAKGRKFYANFSNYLSPNNVSTTRSSFAYPPPLLLFSRAISKRTNSHSLTSLFLSRHPLLTCERQQVAGEQCVPHTSVSIAPLPP
ncbi:hypothetical protein ACTXT7_009581 [Hymenolepis weldensis]